MKVLVTGQIRSADAYTISHEPVLSLDLMERAALGLARYMESCFPADQVMRIFAGHGNNGGDGIALARLLGLSGRSVFLHAVKPERDWSPDAKANLGRLPEIENLMVSYLEPGSPLPAITPGEILVDALFGSGLSREPEGFMAEVIDHINRSEARVIAVDMPSGLFCEDNRRNTRCHVIKAMHTLAFQLPKLAFFFGENHAYVGDWKVIPIGLHQDFIHSAETCWNYITVKDLAGWLKPREKFSHKGKYGHSLLIAGSTGKMGAAVMAASACIRSGAGLTTVLVPSGGNTIIQTAVPEAMSLPEPDSERWTTLPDLASFNSIGAGPGIGAHPSTWMALEKLFREARVPLVLDADALNLLALNPGSLLKVPKNSILTPHPGEFKRLFGEDPDEYSRVIRLKELAIFYELVIVLKGAHTAVAGPDGSVWFNTTGNPGMATGGSGDVLTGLITGLAASGYDPFTAARAGVFLHGLAGDIAAESSGMEALTASDIIRSLGNAFLRIQNTL